MKKPFFYINICFLTVLFACEEILFEEDLEEIQLQIVSPQEGSSVEGATVNFNWNGAAAIDAYRIQVAIPDFENTSQIVIDSVVTQNTFSLEQPKGSYAWRVRGENGSTTTSYATASYQVIEAENFSARTVQIQSPIADAISNQNAQRFEWNAVDEATSYNIQFFDASDELISEQTVTNTFVNTNLPEGSIRWQVRAENATQNTLYTSQNLIIDSQNPKQPELTVPINESVGVATMITFEWNREVVAGTTEFDSIYIFRDESLSDLVLKEEATSPSEFTLEAENTYRWFVKSFDDAGNQSENSTVFEFTIN